METPAVLVLCLSLVLIVGYIFGGLFDGGGGGGDDAGCAG